MTTIKNKSGFTLIELSLALAVAGSAALIATQQDSQDMKQTQALALGKEMFAYNAAVGRFIAEHGADPSATVGSYAGSAWLKSGICGGEAESAFLSCAELPDGRTIVHHLDPSTTLSVTSDGSLEARTVWSPVTSDNGDFDGLTMGTAALVASGAYINQLSDPGASYAGPTVFCPDYVSFSSTSSIGSMCGSDRSRMISVASANSSVEPWLRTDHGNTMNHVIEFDDGSGETATDADLAIVDSSSWRQIVNVSRIYNQGRSGRDSIILGQLTGMNVYSDTLVTGAGLLNDAVIADGDLAVMRDLYVKRDSYLSGDLAVSGGVTVEGDISSEKSVRAAEDLEAGRDADIERNVAVGGNIEAQGQIYAVGDVKSDEDLYAKRFYDVDDEEFFVDPASKSKLAFVEVNDFLQLNRVVTAGASCSPNGLVARTAKGGIISCESGKWQEPGISSVKDLYKPVAGESVTCANIGSVRVQEDGTPQYNVGRGWQTGAIYGSMPTPKIRSGTYVSVSPVGVYMQKVTVKYKSGGHSDGRETWRNYSCSKSWPLS